VIQTSRTAEEAIYDAARGNIPPAVINAADADAIGRFMEGAELLGLPVDNTAAYRLFQISNGLLSRQKYSTAIDGLSSVFNRSLFCCNQCRKPSKSW